MKKIKNTGSCGDVEEEGGTCLTLTCEYNLQVAPVNLGRGICQNRTKGYPLPMEVSEAEELEAIPLGSSEGFARRSGYSFPSAWEGVVPEGLRSGWWHPRSKELGGSRAQRPTSVPRMTLNHSRCELVYSYGGVAFQV